MGLQIVFLCFSISYEATHSNSDFLGCSSLRIFLLGNPPTRKISFGLLDLIMMALLMGLSHLLFFDAFVRTINMVSRSEREMVVLRAYFSAFVIAAGVNYISVRELSDCDNVPPILRCYIYLSNYLFTLVATFGVGFLGIWMNHYILGNYRRKLEKYRRAEIRKQPNGE